MHNRLVSLKKGKQKNVEKEEICIFVWFLSKKKSEEKEERLHMVYYCRLS